MEMLSLMMVALSIGLLSSLHCFGMCGGIVGALTVSLPEHVRENKTHLVFYLSVYNFGRIASYVAAGAMIGAFGASVEYPLGHTVLRVLGAGVLVAIGLHVAGWFPAFAGIERVGAPLWRQVEPIGKRLLPVRGPGQALLFGSIWGWFPCGLVYSTLIWGASQGTASAGALIMLAYGIGTLPVLYTTGLLSRWMMSLARQPYLRQMVGGSVALLGGASLLHTICLVGNACSIYH
jgi:uncharacterized protein